MTEFVDKIPYESFDGNYVMVIVGPPPMMKFLSLIHISQRKHS